MGIDGLDRLEAWKKGESLAVRIYKEVLPLLPPEEKWGLNQQIRLILIMVTIFMNPNHKRDNSPFSFLYSRYHL